MKPAKQAAIVLVTAPDLKTARKLARAALEARLAACANLIPKLESHYWWQGKIERSAEVLMLFKTTFRRVAALEKLMVARHPYDTPEFIALPVKGANARYLAWWCGAAEGVAKKGIATKDHKERKETHSPKSH
jgi:periplasmic divalent cation tolerance protein